MHCSISQFAIHITAGTIQMNQKHGVREKGQNKDTTKPESVKEIKL